MSVGEKLVEKAWDSMERDLQEKQSTRRDFLHAVVLAVVICFGLAVAIVSAANHTGISDAFAGGKMAKAELPMIRADLTDIKLNVQRLAGAVDTLVGHRLVIASTQDEACAKTVQQ